MDIDTHIGIYYFIHIWHMFYMTYLTFLSYITYLKWHMTKIPYSNMDVKSSARTSTIQLAAPKLSTVYFNILNLKKKIYGPISFLYFGISFVFLMYFFPQPKFRKSYFLQLNMFQTKILEIIVLRTEYVSVYWVPKKTGIMELCLFCSIHWLLFRLLQLSER
jgi:hypothetical protein